MTPQSLVPITSVSEHESLDYPLDGLEASQGPRVKALRLRLPRFRLRTLCILVALVCIYFGSWPWYRDMAVAAVGRLMIKTDCVGSIEPCIPFVIRTVERPASMSLGTFWVDPKCRYYLCTPVVVVPLPYETEMPYAEWKGRFAVDENHLSVTPD